MPTYTEPKHLGDVLLVEVKPGWTKQNGQLSATALALTIGVVLAQKADGEYTPIDFAGTGVAKKAAAVLAINVDESTTAQKVVLIKRGAVVAKNELVWPAGATDDQIKTALAELEALGIVAEIAL
jgi:hypothetical protein